VEIVSVTPSTISVGETVTVRWRATDATGLQEYGDDYNTMFGLCNPGPNTYTGGVTYGSLVSGSSTDGIWEASHELIDGWAAGEWRVVVYATDVNQNNGQKGCEEGYLTVTP